MSIPQLPDHIDTWVFDLDNTLYPAASNLFPAMDVRMSAYIARLLDVPVSQAKQIQNTYYLKYGTTLAGLMKHHDAEPTAFLDYVHDVDLTPLDDVICLKAILDALPGRKLVFTNGSRKHAARVTEYLGISEYFEAMYGVDDAGYTPKPDIKTYEAFCARFDVEPQKSVFFEDLSVNLKPAKALGFQTVLLAEASTPSDPWVDHLTPCLPSFLNAQI